MSNFSRNPLRVAIIAGTGFETAFGADGKLVLIATPYGDVAASIVQMDNGEIVFLPRHGGTHSIPPHKINYRAQIWALNELGARYILATSAAGSLRLDRKPGDLIILDDFIDHRGGVTTFYEGADGIVRHTDFSRPFGNRARNVLIKSVTELNGKDNRPFAVYQTGTYLCVAGPRYETPAEVRLFGQWGADVVGMTVAPEAILSRELGIEYAAVSVVTNFGTGLSDQPLDHQEVNDQMAMRRAFLVDLFQIASEALLVDLGNFKRN